MNTRFFSLILTILLTSSLLLEAQPAQAKPPTWKLSVAAAMALQGVSTYYGHPIITQRRINRAADLSGHFVQKTSPHIFSPMSLFEAYTEHSIKPYTDIGQRSMFNLTIPPFLKDISWEKGKEAFQEVMGINDLELQLHALAAKTTNGEFTWRIPNVSKYMKRAQSQNLVSIYSPPFYTDATGYKLSLRVYPNGDGSGKNSHLSVFLTVMRGEYDPLLQWPIDKTITLTLLDQNPDHTKRKNHTLSFITDPKSSSYQRPVTWMNISSGAPEFIPLYALQHENTGRPQYVLDDTMYIRVTVRNRLPFEKNNEPNYSEEARGYDEEDMDVD